MQSTEENFPAVADEDGDQNREVANFAMPTDQKSNSSSASRLITNHLFNKRHRSPSTSPAPSPLLARKESRTPSVSSMNASNSACVLDEDDSSARCFCAFPICMNFMNAKAIKRTIDGEDAYVERQRIGSDAKLPTAASLRSRKENLPPNVVRLLESSDLDERPNMGNGSSAQLVPHVQSDTQNGLADDLVPNLSIDQKSIFRRSRFSNVPPTIRFVLPSEKGTIEKPSRNVRRMLKWCYNSLVPKVVRKSLGASHFQIVSEDTFWIGYWGRHLRTQDFHAVLPYQKVNHFPGTFHLGRKDRVWLNIRRMANKWGEEFGAVMPRTFVLPKEAKALKAFMKERRQMVPIILKPPASARGTGVRVVHRWAQIPRKEPTVAQMYVDQPYLIDDKKFDLRLYVFVTCFNPLRIYLYEDGLVRFASVKYSNSLAMLSSRLMHLTNYTLNKRAMADDQDASPVQKWSLKQLWRYLSEKGNDVDRLMERIVDLILKAFISCEGQVNSFIRRNLAFPFTCHELFGVDVVLDKELTPWLLEINISPSFHTSTDLDADIKSGLTRDVLNLAGIRLPDKQQVHDASIRLSLELTEPSTPDCLDLRTMQNDVFRTEEEKEKQSLYVRKYSATKKTEASILDRLTPSDVRVLVETEDEFDRRGQFARIFPSPLSTRYLKYFEKASYYNLLLEEWIGQYGHIRETGCLLLESLCKDNYHLQKPKT